LSGIGYYVHHHGTGHLSRALAIAQFLPGLTLLGTGLAGRCGDVACIDLPDDRASAPQLEGFPESLHYAPLRCDALRQRTAVLTGWIAAHRPDLIVVDVSVEVAMLARLASTPVLYVRLAGNRTDAAHLEAFRGAEALLAPFHQALDDPGITPWIREKTRYFAGLTPPMPERTRHSDTVLLVLGTGGTAITGTDIISAAVAMPQLQWRVIGQAPPMAEAPANLHCLGWVADPAGEIAEAEIVIGAAGDGVVNAVLAAGRPFICLPQPRPYDEQSFKARRLSATGAAITLDRWPAGHEWVGLIAQAQNSKPPGYLHDPDGLTRAAKFISELGRA
jgi:predicted glycosyltransferase